MTPKKYVIPLNDVRKNKICSTFDNCAKNPNLITIDFLKILSKYEMFYTYQNLHKMFNIKAIKFLRGMPLKNYHI